MSRVYDVVVLGDCLALMREMGDESVDMVIADPPYNLDKDFGVWKESRHKAVWLQWSKEWLVEAVRVLRPGGNIFVYGIHHHLCWLQCFLYDLGMTYRRQIIWNYENGFSGYKRNLAAHYEPLLWFSKGDGYTFHAIREPYKSTERLRHKIIKNGKEWSPHPDGRLAGDVWKFPVLAGRRFAEERVNHPTQKPLSLCRRIVAHFSNPDDLILVPFAGSGSECVAAKELNRRYIAYELNRDYIELALQRLARAGTLAHEASTRRA